MATNKNFIVKNGLDVSGTANLSTLNLTGSLTGPASFTIDPAAIGDNTGTVIIAGNLQVDGTQTTINSTTMSVDDLNLTLASGAANTAAANGAGLTVDGASATITYDSTLDQWTTNKGLQVAGRVEAETAFRAYDSDNTTYRNVLRFDSGDVRLETGTGSSSVDLGLWAGGSKAITVKGSGGIDISKVMTMTTPAATTARLTLTETNGVSTILDARGSSGTVGTTTNHQLNLVVNSVAKAYLTIGGDFGVANDIKLSGTNPRIDYDGGNAGALRFFSTSSNQERARITSAGLVGILNQNPDTELHVTGSVTSSSGYRVGSADRWKIRGNTGNAQLAFEYSTSSALGDANIQVELDSTGGAVFGGRISTRTSGYSFEVKKSAVSIGDGGTNGVLNLNASNNFVFKKNNTTAITVDTNLNTVFEGKVGIGITAPSNKLAVDGVITSGNFTAASISGTPGDANTAEIGPGYLILARDDTADAAQVRFGKNGAVHSYIETRTNGLGFITNVGDFGFEGGKVGIGTASPQHDLVIHNDSGPFLSLIGDGYNDEMGIIFNGGDLNNASSAGNTGAKITSQLSVTGGQVLGDLRFTTNSGDTFVDAMRIDHDGNVGIGADNPSFTAVSGSIDQIGLEIQNANNDSSAHLKLTGRNNTGSPGQATSFEIAHRGDALKTSFIHGGTEVWEFDSSGHAHLGMNDSDTRLTFGNTGTANTNSSNNIRAVSAGFMYNSGGAGSTHIWEVNGAQKLNLNTVGRLEVKSADTSDNYNLVATSTNNADPGLLLVRDSTVGFGIAVRAAANDYADFQVNNSGAPSYAETGKMRIYHNGNISIPGDALWSSVIGHQFFPTGGHYMVRNSASSGNETFIVSNQTGSGGAIGIIQYRFGGSVRGQYLIATDAAGIYFSGTSDYRFKENVSTITDDHLTKLTSLRPITYTEVGDSEVKTGFIAHEVEEVYPEFVDGEKDALWTQEDLDARGDEIDPEESVGDPKYQTLAYTKKEWNVYIIRALQQLKEENEALKARIEVLEG